MLNGNALNKIIHDNRGFSLVTMAIFIMVTGIMFVAGFSLVQQQQALEKTNVTESQRLEIERALEKFANENGRYPCPASMTTGVDQAVGGTAFGQEILGGACDGAAAVAGTNNIGGTVWTGAVPVRTLNLPDQYIVDGFGHRYTYAVTSSHTDGVTNVNLPGAITIQTPDPSDPVDGMADVENAAVFAVISNGPDRNGAFTIAGAQVQACNLASNSGDNCFSDNDTTFTANVYKTYTDDANFFSSNFAYKAGANHYEWVVGSWDACAGTCAGGGTQDRTLACRDLNTNAIVANNICNNALGFTPDNLGAGATQQRACTLSCEWVEIGYGACSNSCGAGTQDMQYGCQRSDGALITDGTAAAECAASPTSIPSPVPSQSCTSFSDPSAACQVYGWVYGAWGPCSVNCSPPDGTQNRTAVCQNTPSGITVADMFCSGSPVLTQSCTGPDTGTPACDPGACGPADGVYSATTPSSNLCDTGSATSVTRSGDNWLWDCVGGLGTDNCSAPATATVNGVCGSANGTTEAWDHWGVSGPSGSERCSAGDGSSTMTFAGTTSTGGTYTWVCEGSGPGGLDSPTCSANVTPAELPVCGTADGTGSVIEPNMNLCAVGSASAVTTSGGNWVWDCTNSYGVDNCSAPVLDPPPACGSANGVTTSTAPSSNLCAQGSPSAVTDPVDDWEWTCANGSGSTTCSAPKPSPPGSCGSSPHDFAVTTYRESTTTEPRSVCAYTTRRTTTTYDIVPVTDGYEVYRTSVRNEQFGERENCPEDDGTGDRLAREDIFCPCEPFSSDSTNTTRVLLEKVEATGYSVSSTDTDDRPLGAWVQTDTITFANACEVAVDGVCGSDAGGSFLGSYWPFSRPGACSAGSPTYLSNGSWSCDGLNGGANPTCCANVSTYDCSDDPRVPEPVCGGSHNPHRDVRISNDTSSIENCAAQAHQWLFDQGATRGCVRRHSRSRDCNASPAHDAVNGDCDNCTARYCTLRAINTCS